MSIQMRLLFTCFATLTSLKLCCGARILALVPTNCPSHFVVFEPLLLELQKRGHHLTVVSSFPQKKHLENFTDIDFSSQLPPIYNQFTIDIIRQIFANLYETTSFITGLHMHFCREVLGNETALNLLNEKFDLLITEIFGADCFNYYAHKMRIPFVGFISSIPFPWVADRVGLPDNPSYIPNYFLICSPNMTFFQRVFNTVSLYFSKMEYYYYSELPVRRLAESVFGETQPSVNELNSQTSLIFLNSHFSFAQSRPLTPNVIEVGGIHIKDAKPLSKDVKEFVDGAKEGVILFSFGSLVQFSSLSPQVIRMFLDVFATLPQRVIFKYEGNLSDTSPNVMYMKWIPQSDIIAHDNVRALITHGGLASTIEAVHYSKPLVVIPFYADQFKNAWEVVSRGAGILLDVDNLTKEGIFQALEEVLQNPSYTENMRRLSQQFRDRPMTPLQTAVYWTEYVIKHQGAPHLRPASVSLPLFQYLLLDVIAVLAVSVFAGIFILYYFTLVTLKIFKLDVFLQKWKKSKKE